MKDLSISTLFKGLLVYFIFSLITPQLSYSSEELALTPSAELIKQRHLFNDAREAIKKGQISKATKLAKQLKDYPLSPYLSYWQLHRKKSSLKAQELATFKDQHGDTSLASRLEHRWLRNIAKQGQWQKLLANYTPSNDVELNCYYRRALYKNNDIEKAFADIEYLWLVGKSQPRACDPLFSAWQETAYFSEELAWQRLKLSMDSGQIYLARYLERFLSPTHQSQSKQWQALHRHPEQVITDKKLHKDNDWNRFLLIYATKRLARYQSSKAAAFWDKITLLYNFTEEQTNNMETHIALRLAKQGQAEAMHWLEHLTNDTDEINEWRLLTAIKEEQWEDVLFWYGQMPNHQKQKSRWQYWNARALEQLDFVQPAANLFALLSKERSYYGFLAASRSQQPFMLQDRPLDFSTAQLKTVARLPAIQRAREFFALGDKLNARREWFQAMQSLSRQQQLTAAQLAHEWGWHDRVINTLGNAKYWDDIELRFPLAHNEKITHHARQQHVDPAWAYAIIRQESAFTADARSPKGALGLMQIMPSTGEFIAKSLKTRLSSNYQLIDIDTNIRFGINYLNTVMNRFNQNTVIATAAYNAGSSRVRSWLPNEENQQTDQWIELIPYKETRNYVKNVLAYTIIYNQRMGQAPHTVLQKNATIKGKEVNTEPHSS